MINLEKIKQEKCQPPHSSPSLLRRPAPTPFFHPIFKFFRSPLLLQGRKSKLTPPLLKRGVRRGSETSNFLLDQCDYKKKYFLVVSSGLELEFHPPSLSEIYIYICILYYIVFCKPMHHAN